jgi:hypothetical protein
MMHEEDRYIDRQSDGIPRSSHGRKGNRKYTIRIRGHLNQRCMQWFDGFTIDLVENGDSLLCGVLEDQAALHGALQKIRDLNLTLLSVTQVYIDDQENLGQKE